jgi:DNA repair protein RecO (recombination protein O)
MRPSYATPAIVLRTRPFGEADKIVSFLTERFGKITGIAKGALRSRKRFVNSLEPLAIVNLRFQDRPHSNLAFILNADLILGYRQLATSLERICHAAYLVDITDGLVGEREESLAVYQHLRDSLRYLEQCGTSLRFLTAFELKLLRLVGYQPVLDNCMRCGRHRFEVAARRWYFSIFDGGIFCDSCADSRQEMLSLDAKAIEVLNALLSEPGDLSSSLSLPLSLIRDMRAVMLRFIQFHMVREIRSASFLERFATANFGKS